MTGDEAKEILEAFIRRSAEIADPQFVEKQYRAFARSNLKQYLNYFSGKQNRFMFKVINKLSGHRYENYSSERYKRKTGAGIRNYIECEAHRELITEGLKEDDFQK